MTEIKQEEGDSLSLCLSLSLCDTLMTTFKALCGEQINVQSLDITMAPNNFQCVWAFYIRIPAG